MGNYLIIEYDKKNSKIFQEIVLNTESDSTFEIYDYNTFRDNTSVSFIPEITFIEISNNGSDYSDLCKRLRINPITKNTPIVFIGTKVQIDENYNAILDTTFDGILTIPLSTTEFKLLLKSIQNRRKNSENYFTEFDEERQKINSTISAASLKEQEDIYKNLVDRLPDGVYKSTHAGKFVEVNPAMVNMLGYDSKEELLEIDIKNDLYFIPSDRESATLMEKNEEVGIFRLMKKDGSEIWVEDHGWYILDDEGSILFHEGIMRDITSRKQTEIALAESEERFKMLFEKAPICYQSLNADGYIINTNEAFTELFGHPKNEVIGRDFKSFVSPNSEKIFNDCFEELKQKGKSNIEFDVVNKDGEVLSVQMEGRLAHLPDGSFNQIHCVFTDITERKRAEKIIADEKILLRTLIDNIPDLIYIKDKSARKIVSNVADLDFFGFKSETEVIGKTDLDLFNNDAAIKSFNDDLFVLKTSSPILNKLEYFHDETNHERVISTTKLPLFNEHGEITGIIGIGRDITTERETKKKLIQLSKGIEQSPASIIITDSQGNIEYVNQSTLNNSGYEIDEVLGKNSRIFQSGYTPVKEYTELWSKISSGNEYRHEILNRRKNGELYWESLIISPIKNDEGEIINYIAIKEDITTRKQSDLEIKKLSMAIEQNPVSVVITNTQGEIEYINTTFSKTSGYTKQELIGKVLRILKPGHTTEDTYVEIWNCLFAGKQWKGEQQNRNKQGEKFWESVLISPLKNSDGEVSNFIVLSEDISERKKMADDLLKAKERAEESDRLKSAFLANMSHEIRTPLNSILGFSDLLNDASINNELKSEFAELINLSGNNLLTIINDVLDISKIEAGQITIFNNEFRISSLLNNIQKEYTYKANAKGIELRISPNLKLNELCIYSDEARIKQILINFIGNALKFTNHGYIEIGFEVCESFVIFNVKDTGIGIDKLHHEKIFERFRQVEEAQTRKFGGNGLGLAITKNLVELLGGKVWLESAKGEGSTFYFSIPIVKY